MIQKHALSNVHLIATLTNRLPIFKGSSGLLQRCLCRTDRTVLVLMSSGCTERRRIERRGSNNHLVTVDVLDYGAAAAKCSLTQLHCTLTQQYCTLTQQYCTLTQQYCTLT